MEKEAIARQYLDYKKKLADELADEEKEKKAVSQASREEVIRAVTNYHEQLNYAGKLFSALKHQGPRSVQERKAYGFDSHEKHKVTVIDLGEATLDGHEPVATRAILTDSFYSGMESARHGRTLIVSFAAKGNSDPDDSYEFIPGAHCELKDFPIIPGEYLSFPAGMFIGSSYKHCLRKAPKVAEFTTHLEDIAHIIGVDLPDAEKLKLQERFTPPTRLFEAMFLTSANR
ncbi:MAG: hypothetical protein AAB909_04220 [Patescibacteria group bacterium]